MESQVPMTVFGDMMGIEAACLTGTLALHSDLRLNRDEIEVTGVTLDCRYLEYQISIDF